MTLLKYKGPFPLSLAPRGSAPPGQLSLPCLEQLSQYWQTLPSANISVLLEPGEQGVGNKDSTLLSEGRTYSQGPEQSVLLRLRGEFRGAVSLAFIPPFPGSPPPTSQEDPRCLCRFSRVASWAQRCLPHPRSNTTVWFGRGHSAVQTTVCCWGGSRTGGLRGRENETVLGRPSLPRAGRERRYKRQQTWPPRMVGENETRARSWAGNRRERGPR